MAEVKLAMSLDELIAQAGKKKERKPAAKPAKPAQGGGGAPATGARKGLKKNRQDNGAKANGQQQQQQPKQKQAQPQQQQQQRQGGQQQQGGQRVRQKANLGVRQGQVQKRTQVIEVPTRVLRQQAPLAQAPPRVNRAPYRTQPAPEDSKWQHDMYEDHAPAPRRAPVSQAATSTKLIIRNLHHGVSADDVLELFSTCGSVKNHGVNFDASGRSLGTGFVVFESRAEAMNAKKEYNGVKLDGQGMEILFAEEVSGGGGGVQRLSSGIQVQRPGAGDRTGGGGGGGGGGQRLAAAAFRETAAAGGPRSGGRSGGRGGRLRSAVVGRAALERGLDDYMMQE